MTAAASPATATSFWMPDGTFDFGQLARELEANLAQGISDISAATRSLTKDRLGVSDEFINHHVRGQLAILNQSDPVFYEKVGGKEVYETKLAWAKDSYTPEQKARFNAAIKKGGEEAEDALDLLSLRYGARAISTSPSRSTVNTVKEPDGKERD